MNKELIGKRIELVEMVSDPHPIETGTKGTVTYVDALGTLHVDWDNGRGLGVIPNEDVYKFIED